MPEEPTLSKGHKVDLFRLRDLWRWQLEDGQWINSPLAPLWRWKRSDDGEWVSPQFTSLEAAHYFAAHVPFLSDAEWKEKYPGPADAFLPLVQPGHEVRGFIHKFE